MLENRTMKIIATVPHLTGGLSVLGSGWIIQNVLRDEKRLNSVYHRLILGASVGDILSAFWLALSSIPEPRGSFYMAMGNQATCDMQGFFVQLSVMNPLYTAAITLYYLLSVRYRYKEHDLARLEKWVHPIIWAFGLGTAAVGIPLKLYNPKYQWCLTATSPRGCEGNECIRGAYAPYYRVGFSFGWFWLCVLVSTVCLIMLYITVQESERRIMRYRFSLRVRMSRHQEQKLRRAAASSRQLEVQRDSIPISLEDGTSTANSAFKCIRRIRSHTLLSGFQGNPNNSYYGGASRRTKKSKLGSSRHVASLATGYVAAFIVTMLPATIHCIKLFPRVAAINPLIWATLMGSTFPLQGFFTFLVYTRPNVEAYFRKKRIKRVKNADPSLTDSCSNESPGLSKTCPLRFSRYGILRRACLAHPRRNTAETYTQGETREITVQDIDIPTGVSVLSNDQTGDRLGLQIHEKSDFEA